MVKLLNLVKVNIATTGTGTVTFGSAFSNAFFTPSEAGAADGDSVSYVLVEGDDTEIGTGVIGSSVTTMTRTVLKSKIGGVAGTTKMTLGGTAWLAFTALDRDISVPANNLSDVEDPDSAADNIGAYRAGTILGTVSQSSGVPTGAIIETGSNANGSYTKYADGTLICLAIINSGSLTIANPFLGGYRSDAQAWTFPVSFVGASPSVSIIPTVVSAFGVSLSSVTTSLSNFVYTAVTSQSSATRQASAIAIGRWF